VEEKEEAFREEEKRRQGRKLEKEAPETP